MPSLFRLPFFSSFQFVIHQKASRYIFLTYCKAPCPDGGESLEVNATDVGILDLINYATQVRGSNTSRKPDTGSMVLTKI